MRSAFAWELVTSPEWFGIPKDRLYVTIFEGDPANGVPRDDEAERFWIEVGVPKERIEFGVPKATAASASAATATCRRQPATGQSRPFAFGDSTAACSATSYASR